MPDLRGTPRRTAVASGVMVVALLLVGCSGSDEPSTDPEPTPSASSATPKPKPKPVSTRIEVAEIYGSLSKPLRTSLVAKVERPIDAWFQAAYLAGEYPRTGFDDAFPASSFTAGAASQARADRALMSNAGVGERVSSVTARRKNVKLDVVAPNKIAAGVTARFRLVFVTAGERAATDTVRGRLLLTRTTSGWRVFGYDVTRASQQRGQR